MSKSCIFCGRNGNKSKEHLWPEWMHLYLPSVGDGNHIREVNTFQWNTQVGENKLKRPGNIFTIKARVVCKDCNSGWMSRLEEAVKPTFTRMIKGEKLSLHEKDQELLSRWIAMKVIVGEHVEKGIHVTPKRDRHLLKEENKIPEYFAIHVSSHASKSDTAWLRISNTLALSPNGPNPPLVNVKRNTQSIAFLCGRVFIFVFASREVGIDSTAFIKTDNLHRIYPQELENIEWPTEKPVTKQEMGNLAWALDELKKYSNVHYGGPLEPNVVD